MKNKIAGGSLVLSLLFVCGLALPIAALSNTGEAPTPDSITSVQASRIRQNCTAAQSKIVAVAQKVDADKQAYQTKFDAYTAQLRELSSSLQGSDSDDMRSHIGALEQKYQVYLAQATQFAQFVGEVSTLQCKQEPQKFKDTLENVRAAYVTLTSTRDDVTVYADGTVNKFLSEIKTGN